MIGIHIDNCLVIGNDKAIINVIKGLKEHKFGVKVEEFLSNYLSCNIHMNRDNKVLFVMQPHLIKSLEDKFQEEVNNLSIYGTPGTPYFKIVKSNKEV